MNSDYVARDVYDHAWDGGDGPFMQANIFVPHSVSPDALMAAVEAKYTLLRRHGAVEGFAVRAHPLPDTSCSIVTVSARQPDRAT